MVTAPQRPASGDSPARFVRPGVYIRTSSSATGSKRQKLRSADRIEFLSPCSPVDRAYWRALEFCLHLILLPPRAVRTRTSLRPPPPPPPYFIQLPPRLVFYRYISDTPPFHRSDRCVWVRFAGSALAMHRAGDCTSTGPTPADVATWRLINCR